MSHDAVSQKPVGIFISYSPAEDRRYAEELKKHLSFEESSGRIRVWYDANLTPGGDWEEEIYDHFCSSSIILMLVSPDFFASDYCTGLEMPAALKRHENENDEAIVVPVIIRPYVWQRTPLKRLMVLPKNGKPIDDWEGEDQYFADVTTSLFEVLDKLIGPATASDPNPWVSQPTPARKKKPVATPQPSSDVVDKPKPDRFEQPSVAPQKTSPEQEASKNSGKPASAKVLMLVVCFVHRERRHKLVKLRKWSLEEQEPPFDDYTVKVIHAENIARASQYLNEEPDTTILLLDGFEPGSAQLDGVLDASDLQRPYSVIFNSPEWDQPESQEISASNDQPPPIVTSDETLFPTLHKALLKKCATQEQDVAPSAEQGDANAAPDSRAGSRVVQSTPPPAGSPEEYRKSVRSSRLRIVVCFAHPESRQKLAELRKWSLGSNEPLFSDQTIEITASKNFKHAAKSLSENPDATVLLLDGFVPGTPELDEVAETTQKSWPFNVIINPPSRVQVKGELPSASILQSRLTITTNETLFPALRKALLRVRTRQFATASVVDTPEELAACFEMRYRVWSGLDYLSEEKKCPETPWELDYTDRTSLPLGIFSKSDGKLLGGARLVRGLGEDSPELIRTVTAMLQKRNADRLLKNFQYPTCKTHPFDILGELDRFKEYYRSLVLDRTSKAEVSRVVVAPEYRKLGLGEVIVDTLCSMARINSIDVLFLACHTKHADFYRRSQFEIVPGVQGDKFLTYQVPCIAMDRTL